MFERHGDSGTRLYNIWKGMKNRCKSTYCTEYLKKGIKVCPEWHNSYTAFRAWANSNGYSQNASIDRIDNDGNYEPNNCRWTSQLVQSANTRILYKHNKSGYRGVSWNVAYQKWEVSISVNTKTIKIGYYDLILDAAKAYDTYVTDNDLPHTTNGFTEKVESNTGRVLTSVNTSGYVGVSAPKRIAKFKNPWTAQVTIKKTRVFDGYFPSALSGALHREKFIIDSGLKSKRNFSDYEYVKLWEHLQKHLGVDDHE